MTVRILSRLVFAFGLAACVLTLAVIIVPIAIVIVSGFLSRPLGGGGAFTLEHYAYVLGDYKAIPQLATTLAFAVGSTIIAVGLAGICAWGIAFVDLPFKRVLRLMPLAVLILPTLLKDPAWIELYSPKIGLINLALMKTFGLEGPVFNIYTLTGMILSAGVNLMPVAFIILLAPFEHLDQSFAEASRMSGARPWRTIRKVVIPILAPAFLSAIALTMILVASAFETPILIGLPGGVVTYMSAIFGSVTGAVQADLNRAAAQSTVYLILTGALLAWYMLATRKERRFVSISSQARINRGVSSPFVRYLFLAIFIVYFIIAFVLPMAMTLLVSFLPFYSVSSGNPLRPGFSLVHYADILTDKRVIRAFATSLWVSAVAVVASLSVAAGLTYIAFKTNIPGRRYAEILGTLPISIPALVFGFALLITFVSIPGARIFYSSYAPMIVAEVVIFLPFAIRVMSAALIQVENSLLEAGRLAGASRGRVFRDILLPILGPALLNAGALVFILSFRELGAVVLLIAAYTVLVPTVTFETWIAANLGGVAALNVVALIVPAAAMGVGYLLIRGIVRLVNMRNAVMLPGALQQMPYA
jgi:iron(III) transport system permease protein